MPGDIEARTIGLGRAALRSLAAHPAEMIAILQAYSDGVNSFLDAAEAAGQLPPEYGGLGLGTVKRWEPLDSILVGKALGAGTSLDVTADIDLTIALQTYQGVGMASGLFDGSKLFFDDLFRSAPFDPASTVPDALNGFASQPGKFPRKARRDWRRSLLDDDTLEQGREYRKRLRELRKFPGVMPLDGNTMGGSNSWVVSGRHTPTGVPLLASDMHLALESPTIFHEVHLVAPDFMATGSSLPGAPCVVRGHNRAVTWGITNARMDITDIYAELIQPDATSPSGLSTVHNGVPEHIEILFETIRANVGGVLVDAHTQPVLIVPRRNQGPLITAPAPDSETGMLTALSVQSVGFGPSRDPEGICGLNRARNLDEFREAIQLMDFASQHLTYADRHGNIAYFVTGEVPLREDVQNPGPGTTPPFLIRNGFSGNEWIPLAGELPENQATPFEILPFAEMPQVINPPSGIIVNANNDASGNSLDNDPLNDLREGGNGLRYLKWGGTNFSLRAGRITEMLNQSLSRNDPRFWHHGKITFADMKAMQADTVLSDAKALTPFILQAYANATDSSAHPALAFIASKPGLAEAVQRLRDWNFTTPTGLAQGYDADTDSVDVDASVATTIYSTWRGAMVTNTIDATLNGIGLLAGIPEMPRPSGREEVVTALKHLLENDGVGVSELNFFNVAGIEDAAVRRDIIVLVSLGDALDLLGSEAFAPAFARSDNQDDYRWGRLHRIVIEHPLGGVEPNFNVPPAFGLFPTPLADLPGIPVDGAFETVDAAPPLDENNVRVSDSDSFMFNVAPTGRFVARAAPFGVRAITSVPGGESNVPGSPYYVNLLDAYLKNEAFPLLVSRRAVKSNAVSTQRFVPSSP